MLWCYVLLIDNFVDLGSCGGSVVGVELWWDGFVWFLEFVNWLDDIMLELSFECMVE